MSETTKGTIGRKRKKNGFTQISNTMLEDTRLSWRAKGLLCYMLSRPDNWKINKTDLYKRATEGRDAMQVALNELKEFGYLHIYPNHTEAGLLSGWIWEYDDTPFSPEKLENRTTENPQHKPEKMRETRLTEIPTDGFPEVRPTSIYNNTDFNNTDYNNKDSKEIKKKSNLETEFEQLWAKYPRKIGKKKAFDSFKKARKKVPFEDIENGLNRYIEYLKSQGTDEQFIQHGSTWFNQEKWQDEFQATQFDKKPKLNDFTRMCLNEMDDPDDFLNMIGVNSSYEQGRNRKIIDVSEIPLSSRF